MADSLKRPPVEGLPTNDTCPQCGKQTVLLTYQRFASRVMFCTSCGHVWTVRGPQREEP